MSPDVPEAALPVVKLTGPELPLVEFPVSADMVPVFPAVAVLFPVYKSMVPDVPDVPVENPV